MHDVAVRIARDFLDLDVSRPLEILSRRSVSSPNALAASRRARSIRIVELARLGTTRMPLPPRRQTLDEYREADLLRARGELG